MNEHSGKLPIATLDDVGQWLTHRGACLSVRFTGKQYRVDVYKRVGPRKSTTKQQFRYSISHSSLGVALHRAMAETDRRLEERPIPRPPSIWRVTARLQIDAPPILSDTYELTANSAEEADNLAAIMRTRWPEADIRTLEYRQ